MPWGKYGPENFPPSGADVCFINSGYLKWLVSWCIENTTRYIKNEPLVLAVEEELKFRDQQNVHFWEDKVIKQEIKEANVMEQEQFVPANHARAEDLPVQQAQPVPQTQPQAIDLKANMELAKVVGEGRVMVLIERATMLQQLQQFKRIDTQEQYEQAIDAFGTTGAALKELESLRHEFVDFPTKVVSLINQFFKSVRDPLQATKDHLGNIIDVKKKADEEAYARQAQGTQEQAAAGEPQTRELDGVGVVDFDGGLQAPPENVVTSARGAKVHTRSNMVVTVTDLVAFLKTCVSKNQRNLWLSEKVSEVVRVDVNALKKLILDNDKKKVPGIEINVERKTV